MRKNRFEAADCQNRPTKANLGEIVPVRPGEISGLILHRDGGKVVEIFAHFTPRNHEVLRVNLSFLLKLPNLWKPIASGFRLHFDQLSATTVRNSCGDLNRGLVAYMVAAKMTKATLADLRPEFWGSYIHWLNSTEGNGVAAFSLQTREKLLGTLRWAISALATVDVYRDTVEKVLEGCPRNPWRAVERKVTPRKRLTREHLHHIMRESIAEIAALEARFIDGNERIRAGQSELAAGSATIKDSLNAMLATVNREFPISIPRRTELTLDQLALSAIALRHHGGFSKLRTFLYPSPRDFVPLVLVLAVALGMNPETLLSLKWEDIQFHQLLGKEVVVIRGIKNRAATNPTITVRTDVEVWTGYSIGRILSVLKDWTARIRPGVVIPAHRDRLFIFVGEPVTHTSPRSYGGSTAGSIMTCCTDIVFTHNLKRFIDEHRIQHFSLAQIRTTVLDETFLLTGDIKAVQAIGQQRSPWTILNHYTSDGTRSRLMERLGGSVFLLRERWWASDGRIDPRAGVRGYGKDRGAATPGFRCLDPFSSQRPGQREGKLCTAYGECPDCEMAVGSDAVEDVANYLALHDQVMALMPDTSDLVWIRRWRPILVSLNQIISMIPTESLSHAQEFRVGLPPLPTLE